MEIGSFLWPENETLDPFTLLPKAFMRNNCTCFLGNHLYEIINKGQELPMMFTSKIKNERGEKGTQEFSDFGKKKTILLNSLLYLNFIVLDTTVIFFRLFNLKRRDEDKMNIVVVWFNRDQISLIMTWSSYLSSY